MAGSGQEKTEQPSAKRLGKARSEGNVVKSQDLNSAIVLAAALMLLCWVGPYTLSNLYGISQHIFTHLDTKPITIAGFIGTLSNTLQTIIYIVMPFFIGMMIVGIVSNVIQVKFMFTTHPLKPNFSKLNPISGFKKFFTMRSLVELAKALLKTIIVGSAGYGVVSSHMPDLMMLNSTDLYHATGVIISVIWEVALWSCITMFILGIVDYFYQRYEYIKGLKMSKQDVKEERKEAELDPHIKGRIRQMGRQFTQRKQLAAVPKADVVITNPTHYAIAIQYDPDLAPAPMIIAKGHDDFAMQIREVAKANKVPIIENKPLARALYAMVEVDRMVPPEMFVAVAEVLAYVFSKTKGRGGKNKNLGRPTR